MKKADSLATTLSRNLQALMDTRGLSQAELGRLSGVGQSTLSRILDADTQGASNPRVTTLEAVASYFGVAAWQLLVPGLDPAMCADGRLGQLVAAYCAAPEIGQQTILRIAESEARYAAAALPLQQAAS